MKGCVLRRLKTDGLRYGSWDKFLHVISFLGFDMSAWGFFFFLAGFPILYIFLLMTGTLAYFYNPFWRIGAIILMCSIYIWHGTHKKYTKRENDFLEDVSLRSGRVNGIEYFYTANHGKKRTSITT